MKVVDFGGEVFLARGVAEWAVESGGGGSGLQIAGDCDKVPETSLLFSLFCTVFAIWKHLEAFGYY